MDVTVKDNKLTIVIDLKQDKGPSKSGKTTTIDNTSGEMQVQGADKVYINVNCYRKDK